MKTTEQLLNERNDTHGPFTGNALVAQGIMRVLEQGATYNNLTDVHREALHMIAHKMARIVNGVATFDDHWDDLAGYAQLPKKFNHGNSLIFKTTSSEVV